MPEPITTTNARGNGRELRQLQVSSLLLDKDNPRIGLRAGTTTQEELLKLMVEQFSLGELIQSFSTNGYFHEEPLVAVNGEADGTFVVVEGNRRLAALKLINAPELATRFGITVPVIDPTRVEELKQVPVFVYGSRNAVLPYLGFRHITGVRAWGSYEKARYIAQLDDAGHDPDDIALIVGDQHSTVRRLLETYRVLEQAESRGFGRANTDRFFFSYLFTAIARKGVRDFLGLPERGSGEAEPVPTGKATNELRLLFGWLYGDKEGEKPPVISKAADINDLLGPIIESVDARTLLEQGKSLEYAYTKTSDEGRRLLDLLIIANDNLESAKAVVHRHKRDGDAKGHAQKCLGTATALLEEFE